MKKFAVNNAKTTLLIYIRTVSSRIIFNCKIGFCACSGASIKYILNGPPGNVCVVVVGGVAEMMKSTPGTNKLVLRNRKGFVRLALKAG